MMKYVINVDKKYIFKNGHEKYISVLNFVFCSHYTYVLPSVGKSCYFSLLIIVNFLSYILIGCLTAVIRSIDLFVGFSFPVTGSMMEIVLGSTFPVSRGIR